MTKAQTSTGQLSALQKKPQIPSLLFFLPGVIAAAVYPLVFLWMNNAHLIRETGGIWTTLAWLAAGGGALFSLLSLIYKNTARAALAAILSILIFENAKKSFIESVTLLTSLNKYIVFDSTPYEAFY